MAPNCCISLGNRKQFVFETQDGKLGSKEFKWAGWKDNAVKLRTKCAELHLLL